MIALTLRNYTELGVFYTDLFEVSYDDKLVAISRQPLQDGARALLDLGHHPDTPLTARHAGKGHDLFVPRPLGELAALQPPTVPASARWPRQALHTPSGSSTAAPGGQRSAPGGRVEGLGPSSCDRAGSAETLILHKKAF